MDDRLSGGETTVFDDSPSAYALPARNLDDDALAKFSLGDHLFNRSWVAAPASVSGSDGLGPTFNANNCSACHMKDGSGRPPERDSERFLGLLLRLSVPGADEHGGPKDEPSYGGQLNGRSISGVPAEGREVVRYAEMPGSYPDGATYSLRKPSYSIEDLAFGPLAKDVMISPRVARATFGLGLLEMVRDDDLLGIADADDRNRDGISGRPNHVWNVREGRPTIGRLGWKANQPTVEQQTAGAFLGDIGITSSLFSQQNCPSVQSACISAPSGDTNGSGELASGDLDAMTHYGKTLGVPARRDVEDSTVRRGKEIFTRIGCASCHTETLHTGKDTNYPALSEQTIHPYTDLLLHEMGEGLADGRPDFEASGTEWRTTPLWGLGLHAVVNKHPYLLHDGRARSVEEAILWHDGEAAASTTAFRAQSKNDRGALLRFLDSL